MLIKRISFALSLALFAAAPAYADTFVVTSLAQSGAGSFREAINAANADVAGADGHRIQFAVTGTITLEVPLNAITERTTILGPGADLLRIERLASAATEFGILSVNNADLIVEGLTLADGTGVDGGGISTGTGAGNLTLRRVHILDCQVTGDGGGIHFDQTSSLVLEDTLISGCQADAAGGGIYVANNTAVVTVTNSTISGNTAATTGGGISAMDGLTLTQSTIAENTAATGGGVAMGLNLVINASIVGNNTATATANDVSEGGGATGNDSLIEDGTGNAVAGLGLLSGDPALQSLANNGGPTMTHALSVASPCVDACANTTAFGFDQRGLGSFRSIGATHDMGAYEVQIASTFAVTNTDNAGAGSLRQAITDANATAGVDTISVQITGVITLTSALPQITGELRIVGPGANAFVISADNRDFPVFDLPNTFDGAVVLEGLTVADSATTTDGGGIRAAAGGTHLLVLLGCEVRENTSDGAGGGIYFDDGELIVRRSAITENQSGATGGGVHLNETGSSILTLESSTVSGNTIDAGGTQGGGLYVEGTEHRIRGATIANNSATTDGGGLFQAAGTNGAILLTNSILADNVSGSGGEDIHTTASSFADSARNNVIETTSGSHGVVSANGNLVSTDPGLLPLTLVIGKDTTRAHEIVDGTIAVDAALALPDQDTDQRNVTRDVGGGPDVGAFERQEENQRPRNSLPSSPQYVRRNGTIVFSDPNRFSISDSDAGNEIVQVDMACSNGTMTLSGTTGLAFTAGSGASDVTMTFQGTITDINAALDGMSYTPTTGVFGGAAIQITTDDLANTGSGGNRLDSDTLALEIRGGGGGGGDSCALVSTRDASPLSAALLGVLLLAFGVVRRRS